MEAVMHHFPFARQGVDLTVLDRSDGLGPQLEMWNNRTLGPQWTQTEVDAELVLVDSEKAEKATIATDSDPFATLLRTGTRVELGTHADQIVDIPTTVTKFKELYLYLASQARK